MAVGLKTEIVAAQEVSKGQGPALKAFLMENMSSLFSQRASVGVELINQLRSTLLVVVLS